MSFKVAVVGDLDTVIGFALAGVRITHVHTQKEETLSKLNELFARDDVGLVLITHPIAEELGEGFKQVLKRKGVFPVVLRIPDRTGYVPEVDELRELIKRTVGAEVIVKAGGA